MRKYYGYFVYKDEEYVIMFRIDGSLQWSERFHCFMDKNWYVRSYADMICYAALVISRILEFRMERRLSVPQILESLRKCNCVLLDKNQFLFSYYDDVLAKLGKNLDIDFSRKYRSLKEIKDELAKTKK